MRTTVRRRARLRSRGFSLVEVLIAVSIMVLASALTMSAFIYSLRYNKATRTNLMLAEQSLAFQRSIKQMATSAERFIVDEGRTLHIVQPDHSESILSYVDEDDSPATIDNNYLLWDPDVNEANDQETIINFITPLDGAAIFELTAGTTSLRVRFRIGDRTTPTAPEDDAQTGLGFQSYVVDTVFTPRNSVE